MSTQIDDLERRAQTAEAKAAELRRLAAEAQARELEVYEGRLQEFDARTLDAFDSEHLRAEERRAYEAFKTTLLKSDWCQAYIAWRAQHEIGVRRTLDADSIARQLGNTKRVTPYSAVEVNLLGEISRALEAEAQRVAAEDFDARASERERYAEDS